MSHTDSGAFHCTYILPIRRVRALRREVDDLAKYFGKLAREGCEVLVVDGSSPEIFAQHNRAWHKLCRHVTVDRKYTYLNGKVNGVHTGVDLASCESIILADDDIRYTSEDIRRACELLKRHDMVRPQNYLAPLPWWGRTEAARMLINRGVLRSGDYPGTCAFRRSASLRFGHYDGDVLFDNEEIVRHFILNGAAVCYALDFFILKRPPSLRKWLEQRPRQAYEDFEIRAKTLLFMSLLPAASALGLFNGAGAALASFFVVSICAGLLAVRGLLRDRAYNFFPAHVILYAPLWLLERSLSVYWALYWRLVHGGYPFGEQLLSKGTGRAWSAARASMRKPHPLTNPSRQG
jgi:Glycosyl transferase family 2